MKLSFAALWGPASVTAAGVMELCIGVSVACNAGRPCNGDASTGPCLGTLLHTMVARVGDDIIAIFMDGDV